MLVPQLSALTGTEKKDLPNYFVMNPVTEQFVPYPYPIDDIKKVSPELILLWARRTVLYIEILYFEQEIKKIKDKTTADATSVTPEEESRMEEMQRLIEVAEEEKQIVIEKFDAIKEKLEELTESAEALEEHKDKTHNNTDLDEKAT